MQLAVGEILGDKRGVFNGFAGEAYILLSVVLMHERKHLVPVLRRKILRYVVDLYRSLVLYRKLEHFGEQRYLHSGKFGREPDSEVKLPHLVKRQSADIRLVRQLFSVLCSAGAVDGVVVKKHAFVILREFRVKLYDVVVLLQRTLVSDNGVLGIITACSPVCL